MLLSELHRAAQNNPENFLRILGMPSPNPRESVECPTPENLPTLPEVPISRAQPVTIHRGPRPTVRSRGVEGVGLRVEDGPQNS